MSRFWTGEEVKSDGVREVFVGPLVKGKDQLSADALPLKSGANHYILDDVGIRTGASDTGGSDQAVFRDGRRPGNGGR